jgi:hypothetical protein
MGYAYLAIGVTASILAAEILRFVQHTLNSLPI